MKENWSMELSKEMGKLSIKMESFIKDCREMGKKKDKLNLS